jgi:ankyrin repeat protein
MDIALFFRRFLYSALSRHSAVCPFDGMIHEACYKDNLEKVKSLLHDNPCLVLRKNIDGATPLSIAAFYGYKDIAQFLLVNGANVHARDNNRRTPLHWAAHQNHKDTAMLLLDNKAKINADDKWGNTPLHIAALKGHDEMVALLIARGADARLTFHR